MKKILCILLVFSLLGCKNEQKETQLIRDHSDQPTKKYSFKQWQELGFDVWKEYYGPQRWEAIVNNSHIISEYIAGTELRLNYLIEKAQKEGVSVDKTKMEILVSILDERTVPVHSWFWFDRKERQLFGSYHLMYNGLCLGSTLVSLPSTVE